jgi:predicted transcriptional regulator
MAAFSTHVPDAELRVLKILWDRENLSAREIAEVLYSRTTSSEIGTVQTLLQRLEAKGLVRRDRNQHVHRFAARQSRQEFTGRQLEAMAEKLGDGSVAPLLAHLVQSANLSDAQRLELRQLLDEPPPPKRRGVR